MLGASEGINRVCSRGGGRAEVGWLTQPGGQGRLPGGGGDLGRQFGVVLGTVREPERQAQASMAVMARICGAVCPCLS